MYICKHCNISFSDKNDEGILLFRGKMYCKKCEEPIEEIPDTPKVNNFGQGVQATLISHSDNRITTNNFYGGGMVNEQVETPYGPCQKNEARLCKKCRQWIPVSFYNQEEFICDDCKIKEAYEIFDEGKGYMEIKFYDEAISCFLKYESVCSKDELPTVKTLIGQCYYEQKNYKQALKYFIFASKKNNDSLYYLGQCFFHGYGVDKDVKKASDFFHTAADKGNNNAIGFLLEQQRIEEQKKAYEDLQLFSTKVNGKYGFVDQNDKVIIPCKWQYVGEFCRGYCRVRDVFGKYGLINKRGEYITPCIWKNVDNFSEGLARVKNSDNKIGYINEHGELSIPCIWEDDGNINLQPYFHNGIAKVKCEDGKLRYIDKTGKIVHT